MSKIDFNSDNYGHRLMLALAIRDYTNTPGHTLTGQHNGSEVSLIGELKEAGIATSRPVLNRIKAAPNPASNDDYVKNAREVAAFLEQRGYFPPGRNIEKTLKVLPLFFDGVTFAATDFLTALEGEYQCYQFSNRKPDHIVVCTATIGALTPWGFAEFCQTIPQSELNSTALYHEGIVFADEEKNLYALARERNNDYPRFFVFEDCGRNESGEIDAIYGAVLGGARLKKRHLSPVALYRGEQPMPDGEVTADDMSALPKGVRFHLAKDMNQY